MASNHTGAVHPLSEHPAPAAGSKLSDAFPGSSVLFGQVAAIGPANADLPVGAPLQAFALPVDAQLKATQLRLLSWARPHMRAFHLAWLAFFLSFMTCFAPASLLPVLRDSLDLTTTDIGNAGIASVCGAIASRVVTGTATDLFGPRYGAALTLLGTAPFVFGISLIHGAAAFVALRMLVGLGLSMFVVNQSWMTYMFNTKLLGRANALSAGWGNTGAGATLLLMPLLYEALAMAMPPDMAWRWSFFVPGGLQVLVGCLVLVLADDVPQGRLPQISRGWCGFRTSRHCSGWQAALSNYRTYIAALAYALCFGVELSVHNVVSLYLFNHFGLTLTTAGILGGVLGLMNVASRFLGGAGSDLAGSSRGMRGRLWVLQVTLMLEGLFCLLVGISHDSLAATLGTLFVFSFFCQAACGAVFGIVPFISQRSTGLVVGIVAAGGNLGSAVFQAVFFSYGDFTPYEGFYWMGTTIICLAALISLVYWPMWGGMCCAPRSGDTEERYYLAEYNSSERAAGDHLQALAFAHESRSERDPHGLCGGLATCALLPAKLAALAAPPQPEAPRMAAAGSSTSSLHSRTGLLPPALQLAGRR